jgi:adenylate cyclase
MDLLPLLPKATLGFFTPDPDSDSVIRRIQVVVEYGGAFFISLAMRAVSKYLRITPVLERDENGLWMRSREGGLNVPLSNYGGMFARYYGKERTFHYEEFADVVNDHVKNAKEVFNGKIVFVGATATGLKDIRATPFSSDYPGVETHATIASNILNNEFMVKDHRYFVVGYFFLIALGLLSWVVYRYHPLVASVACVIAIAVVQLVVQNFYFNRGIVVPSLMPCLELVTLLFTGILYRYFTEEKEKKFVRTAFSRYVSGAVVEELLKDQTKLQLGGQKKELTVMFSDLAGFTKLSEHLDAAFVTLLLNEYFTRMTEVILRNHGTLDKYMGDGIMCFWGAPLDLPDHAVHACRAAVEMGQELERLNVEWQA